MLEEIVTTHTEFNLQILNAIFEGYQPLPYLLLENTFKSENPSRNGGEAGNLFDFALAAGNEDAALLINNYSTKSPSEKTARVCILNNLPKVLDAILSSGLSADVKFPDGDTGLHKACDLGDTEVIKVLQKVS